MLLGISIYFILLHNVHLMAAKHSTKNLFNIMLNGSFINGHLSEIQVFKL